MKTLLNLIALFVFSFVTNAQSVQKELEEMDSANTRGEYEKAKSLALKIYPLAQTLGADSSHIDFLSSYGSLCYRTGDYEKGAELFIEASEKAKSALGESNYRYPLALFNLASCYKEQGRYAEAEPLYLQSLPPLAAVFGQSSIEYTRCFYTLALMYIDMSKYAEAEGMCAAAVNFYKVVLGETSDDYLGALGAMALVYQGQAKYDKAEEIFLALKNYHGSQPEPPTETMQVLENNLGELYRHMGEYEKAEAALLKAVSMAEQTTAAAFSLNNLALVQKAIGKYSEAEQSYKQALNIYHALGRTNHPDYTNPLNNLGELYRVMGRLQEAVYAFEEVIVLRKKFLGTDHPNYANALNNLALVEFAVGMYPEAEKHLTECKDIYKRTLGEKDKYYANCINNLASVYKIQGNLLKAEEYYKECIRIFKASYGETNDRYGIFLGGLGGTYRQMKRYDEAIDYTLQSLNVLRNKLGPLHYDHIETEYNLAETYREAGKFSEAEKHYQNAMKGYLLLIEKYFPYLSEKDKTAFYYNVANAFETFNSFVIEMKLNYPSRNIDSLISRMYDNQVALKSLLLKESEKIRSGIAASNSEELKKDYREWMRLRETIVQYYRLSPEELDTKGINLPQLELNVNNLEQKITIALKMGYRKDNRQAVQWKDIQAGLKTGEMAVEMIRTDYFSLSRWTDTVYYTALIIDKQCKTPAMVVIKEGSVLESKSLAAYRRALRTRVSDEASYAAFWEPLKNTLADAMKIYFSADGVYHQVNLHTLKNPATKKYLIDESDIRLVTNTRDILQTPVAAVSKDVAIFSYPDYGNEQKTKATASNRVPGFPELSDLPGTRIEADSLNRIFTARKWKVKMYLQKEATEEAIKKVNSPRILHIATHGFFLKDVKDTAEKVMGIQSEIARQNPLLRSGVILAGASAIARDSMVTTDREDGILTAYEAAGLSLDSTDLVILSACETGLGELLNGQGVYGLQRALLLAGAQSVMMSLWKIDDAATQELMTSFCAEWAKDPTPVNKQKAFRAAQLQLKEKYKHPFYWGAFVIVGE